ncbi:hypothetical protein GYA13_00535 [Candidatus Kuenenbacteria bacterium]|nr:hypothetical protein [Candidatus Kuenenbacteria bacterium]
MNKLIIFEGIDATGKTTLAKRVAEELNGLYYKTPPPEFRSRCIEIDKNGVVYSPERFRLYLKCIYYSASQIQKILKNNTVVVDRWIWTTLAYHFAHNPKIYEQWRNNWQSLICKLPEPNKSILLFVEEVEWLRRITKRGIDAPDAIVINNPDIRKKIFDFYQQLNPSFCLVENAKDIETAVKNVLSLIKK